MSPEHSVDSSSASDDSPGRQGALSQQPSRALNIPNPAFRVDQAFEAPTPISPNRSPGAPLQKRRRVTRACDECRKKKIKCDGKQPCTHCQVYTYECTYDQPSNRRRNPDPQHVEALEIRLRRAKKLLNNFVGDVNLDDPSLDEQVSQAKITRPRQTSSASTTGQDSMLETMVETTGSLDLDDNGCWDFSGHSSGRSFLRHLRAQFGQVVGTSERHSFNVLDSRGSSSSSPDNLISSGKPPTRQDLPPKKCARIMCQSAFDDVCAVLRPVHEPSFYAMFDRIYDRSRREFDADEKKFIPLFYAVIALGALFSREEKSLLETKGFENAIDQGSKWYHISRAMTDVTDVRDMISLQTVLFMVLFLQCSAKLSNCYAHIGICLSSALRMGLHRSIDHAFNPIEQETRKRIFWCIVKLDVYVGALLGLPRMLSSEDIDQEEPLEVDDEYITSTEIKSMPPGHLSLMAGFNAHSRIVDILSKVVKYIYPIKNQRPAKPHTYIVSHTRIREIEHDLQDWLENLPEPFKPGGGTPRRYVRIQHILRMAYAHIEMFLYRPFLHYVSRDLVPEDVDQRSYACSAACVNVSRNVIHLTDEMNKRKLLTGSYWFYMYTTFFAILSLLFYVLENPESTSSTEIFRDIYEGRNNLAELAPKSLAADKCTTYLNELFTQLSDRLKKAAEISSKAKVEQQTETPAQPKFPILKASSGVPAPRTVPSQRSGPSRISSQPTQAPNARIGPSLGSGSHLPFPQSEVETCPPDPQTGPWPTSSADQGVHDLGAMMFPSEDPFAYPTQPMITLENRQQFRPADEPPQQYFPPTSNAINTEVYGTNIAGYGIVSPSQAPEAYLRSQTGAIVAPNAVNVSQGGIPWQQQAQDQDFRPPQDYDNLFGEDWSAWGR